MRVSMTPLTPAAIAKLREMLGNASNQAALAKEET